MRRERRRRRRGKSGPGSNREIFARWRPRRPKEKKPYEAVRRGEVKEAESASKSLADRPGIQWQTPVDPLTGSFARVWADAASQVRRGGARATRKTVDGRKSFRYDMEIEVDGQCGVCLPVKPVQVQSSNVSLVGRYVSECIVVLVTASLTGWTGS